MNWRRGFFRLWIVTSIAWMVIFVWISVAGHHIVLKKPDIIVHWGNEDIVYPATSSEEEIKADLQRRAGKKEADEEEQFRSMTQEQKNFCERNRETNFDQLPKYCMTYAFHGRLKLILPTGWEDQIHFPPRTILQEASDLALGVFVPPVLLLFVGWIFIWIRRGFRPS